MVVDTHAGCNSLMIEPVEVDELANHRKSGNQVTILIDDRDSRSLDYLYPSAMVTMTIHVMYFHRYYQYESCIKCMSKYLAFPRGPQSSPFHAPCHTDR